MRRDAPKPILVLDAKSFQPSRLGIHRNHFERLGLAGGIEGFKKRLSNQLEISRIGRSIHEMTSNRDSRHDDRDAHKGHCFC